MTIEQRLFSLLLAGSLALFLWSCYRRLSLVTLGRAEGRSGSISSALRYAFAQRRVLARPFGANHAVIFWAFLILVIANGEFLLHGAIPEIRLSALPPALYRPLVFLFDMVSVLALGAVLVAVLRRIVRPPYPQARTGEAFAILGTIALLMLAFFGVHAAEIVLGQELTASAMPVSNFFAALLSGLDLATVEQVRSISWWLHAILLLAFMNYLPYSKHMHILTAIPNCFFRSREKPNTQPREEFSEGQVFGVGHVEDFTWKDLLDSFSCTECGRCQNSCPAAATGKPLNPRQVIHAIKANLLANAGQLRSGGKSRVALISGESDYASSEEALWSCTTCGACLESCPVLIEQMPKIIKMRRHLVEMEARFPAELNSLFENIEGRSNPWGIAPSERSKWSAQLDVKPFTAGATEYLLYVGCAGSFDSRSKQVTIALATILDAAGLSWGTLGRDEKCCGDSLRRLGNEFAFDRLARENAELFIERGISKVITSCPHCFTTLKNDYRQYGLELEVIHHTTLIEDLLRSNRLILNQRVTDLGTILYHDSCYLGRHNDIYQEPRQALTRATGQLPGEFDRQKNDSFCCGAGGGRMWLEEQSGTRINRARAVEALGKKPDTICVSCPYCMTMFGDALKDEGANQIQVKDLAEVVADGLK